MGIYKDNKTGFLHADYTDFTGKRCRPSLHTKDKRIALLKYAELTRASQVINGNEGVVNCTLADFLLRYYANIESSKATTTVRMLKSAVSKLQDFKTIKYLAQITPGLLEELQAHLKSVCTSGKVAGINRDIRSLKTMMRQAERWDIIPPQNWLAIQKFKEPKGRVEFHTEAEVSKLLLAASSMGWRLVVLLGSRAGLRRGEMAALKWVDVDFKNNQLYIAPNKTDKHRYVPISSDLLKELKEAKKQALTDFVVEVGQPSSRNTKDFLTSYYGEICQTAGIKGFIHKLRHTFASHLVQNGVDLYTVSKLLGHSDIKMTEIYAHLAPDTLHAAILKLPKIK